MNRFKFSCFLSALCASVGLIGLLGAQTAVQADPASGIYRITPRGQQGMCLDVGGWGNSDQTPVDIWTWGGNAKPQANQQWLIEAQGDGTYKIYAYSGKNSLQMLDDANGGIGNGNVVNTYEDLNNTNQRWYLQDTGGGWYRFIPGAAGPNGTATLDITGGNGAGAGATTEIYGYWGGDNQVFRLDYAGPQSVIGNGKKGIGGRETKVPYLNGSWEYTWGSGEPGDQPTGVEFVPMEWGYYGGDNSQWVRDTVAQPGVKYILGFNEPDHPDQANLSVSYAETGFQYLKAGGVPVGSPACADDNDSWFQQFFDDVDANNSFRGTGSQKYRMDFITVHCYISDPGSFEGYVTALHNWRWQYPLWITEFAPTTWGNPEGVSEPQAESYMRTVVPWLNGQWYVSRYAWYTGASPGTGTLGTSALVNTDGTLTNLGKLYARM